MTEAPLERGARRALQWLIGGLLVAGASLALPVPGTDPLTWVMAQLTVVVVFGLALTMALADLVDRRWFSASSPLRAQMASTASVVILVTGTVALVTLASSAALRLDPSLQFLQLLSALDIAWAAGATALGVYMAFGRRAGWAAGSIIVAICLWSVWKYLDVVGFTASGGWKVEADAMWSYILPYDMMAAVIAVTSLTVGSRRKVTRDALSQPHTQDASRND